MSVAEPNQQSNPPSAERPAERFLMVPEVLHRALMQVHLSGNQHRILNAILFEQLRLRKGKRSRFQPVEELSAQPIGLGAIAKLTGLRPTTVSRELRVLVKQHGLVEVEAQPGADKGHRENLYRVLPPAQWTVQFAPPVVVNSEERDFSKLRRPLVKTEETFADRENKENTENPIRDVGEYQQDGQLSSEETDTGSSALHDEWISAYFRGDIDEQEALARYRDLQKVGKAA